MEELQSTEILDREILEDARKKALRVLKSADEAIAAQSAEWEKKTRESIGELEKKYNEQKETEAGKVMARLPIDKLRAKVENIESMLQSAVDVWYKRLGRAKVVKLLTEELARRIAACEEFSSGKGKAVKTRALYCGLNRTEAEKALKPAGGQCVMKENKNASRFPSIVLETGNVRITASIQNTIDYLLQEKRAELVEALVGREFAEAQ